MVFKEGLNTEIKLCEIIEEENVYYVIEVDRDGNEIGKFELADLFVPYLNRKHTKIKLEYSKEI